MNLNHTKVHFPLTRNVSIYGKTYVKTMPEGESVKCWCCGRPFRVDISTVFIADDGMPIIQCPNPECNKKATVLDYFDRRIKDTDTSGKKPKRKKYKETKYLESDYSYTNRK